MTAADFFRQKSHELPPRPCSLGGTEPSSALLKLKDAVPSLAKLLPVVPSASAPVWLVVVLGGVVGTTTSCTGG